MPSTAAIARISRLLIIALGLGVVTHAAAAPAKKKSKTATTAPGPTPVNKPAAKTTNAPPVDPGTKPKPKETPIPADLEPVSGAHVQALDASLVDNFKQPKHLSKADVAAAAARFSIDVEPNEVQKAVALTVRRPFLGHAHLSFPFARSVFPEVFPDGVAILNSTPSNTVRRVRDSGPPLVLQGVDQEEVDRQLKPFHPGFPQDAAVSLDGNHLAIHFRAAANRDYVISCRVDPHQAERWGAIVHTDAQFFDWMPDVPFADGRVTFAIPRASKLRGVDIKLLAVRGSFQSTTRFDVSRCDITPIR